MFQLIRLIGGVIIFSLLFRTFRRLFAGGQQARPEKKPEKARFDPNGKDIEDAKFEEFK